MHDINRSRVCVGIVSADFFDETSVARSASIGGYDVVECFSFLTVSLKAEACCHERNFLKGVLNPVVNVSKYVPKGSAKVIALSLDSNG